ncbi:MAG: ribonuclease P protein component [Pseudomonadota bacterium]
MLKAVSANGLDNHRISGSNQRISSLKNASEYQGVLQNAKTQRVRSMHMDLFFHPRSEGYRLGLIVSKRCYPRAVDRNRAKRLFREYARIYFRALPPMDAVLRLKQPLKPLTLQSISSYIQTLLVRVRPVTSKT